MNQGKVLVYGNGIVGLTTAKLILEKQSHEVTIIEDSTFPKPIILINKETKFILSSLWNIDEAYWSGFSNVTEKKSLIDSKINAIPFNATALDPKNINHFLTEKIKAEYKSKIKFVNIAELNEKEHFDFEFHCSTSVPQNNYEKTKFGTRSILSTVIRKPNNNFQHTCVLLPFQNIWLFIFPCSESLLVLQIMTTELSNSILSKTAIQIQTYFPEINNIPLDIKDYTLFPAFPWIRDSFHSINKIFVGNSSVSYDPLCGDGLGNALRSCILSTAITSSRYDDEIKQDMLDYYKHRVTLNFISHINTCLEFYSNNNGWNQEINLMKNELKKLVEKPIKVKNEYFLNQRTLVRTGNS